MKKIGNCATCSYFNKCDRASLRDTPSLMKEMFGCPLELREQYREDVIKENKNE